MGKGQALALGELRMATPRVPGLWVLEHSFLLSTLWGLPPVSQKA